MEFDSGTVNVLLADLTLDSIVLGVFFTLGQVICQVFQLKFATTILARFRFSMQPFFTIFLVPLQISPPIEDSIAVLTGYSVTNL